MALRFEAEFALGVWLSRLNARSPSNLLECTTPFHY